MRTKALLVSAIGPFLGPAVNLEKGEWLVDAPPFIQILSDAGETLKGNKILGPARIRARVLDDYSGPPLNLSITQVD